MENYICVATDPKDNTVQYFREDFANTPPHLTKSIWKAERYYDIELCRIGIGSLRKVFPQYEWSVGRVEDPVVVFVEN